MSLKHFQAIVALVVVYFLQWVCVNVVSFDQDWTHSGHTFRFTALETRSGLAPVTPGIASFGLMKRGCRLQWLASNETIDGPSIVKRFREPIEMTGWYLKTASKQGEISNDPVRDCFCFAAPR